MRQTVQKRRDLLAITPVIIVVSLFIMAADVWGDCGIFGCPEEALQAEPGEFNGLRWGQPLGDLKGMKFTAYDAYNPGELYYTREGDLLQLGDAKLQYVQYGFWRGMYSSLVAGTKVSITGKP